MKSADRALTSAELREEVIRLGPWHIDMEITPEVSTSTFLEAPPGTYSEELGPITFHNPHDGFLRRLHRAFPNGLEGRSVLDCACNCGAYLFYAKEAGAGRCLGFDIREHWITQARFLAQHRVHPSDEMRFEVSDLYDLPALDPGRFDITLFLGIFYHLPDPVTGLKIAADLTDEVLIVNTATKAGFADGLLVPDHERAERLMSGTYGLCWFPTGPQLLARVLGWLGFAEVRCSIWRHAPRQRQDLDRLEVIASRTPGFFKAWDAAAPEGFGRVQEIIETHTRPGATVLMFGPQDPGQLQSRRLVGFPSGDQSDEEALARLDRERRDGAHFFAALDDGLERLGAYPALAARLEEGGRVADEPGCRIYALGEQDGRALREAAG